MEQPKIFETASQFSLYIEGIAARKNMSHMEAVITYCEENFIDPAEIKSLINKTLKDKIEIDFRNENYLPQQASLEI